MHYIPSFQSFLKNSLRSGVVLAVTLFLAGVAMPAWAAGPRIEMIRLHSARFETRTAAQYEQEETQHMAPRKILSYTITAYTSLPELTDASPFITANGSHVHNGTIAANCLPFGTQVQFPELFGEQLFTVEDRLHPRKGCGLLDVWLPTYPEAKQFGVRFTTVYIF